jgi:hypothetical protein
MENIEHNNEVRCNSIMFAYAIVLVSVACLVLGCSSCGGLEESQAHASEGHDAVLSVGGNSYMPRYSEQERRRITHSLTPHLEFCRIRDTIYVMGDRYIEVSLPRQTAILRWRNGDSLVIPISSGNPNTKDGKGIATKTGVFSVQNKAREAISRQFDNTKMLWWIGFNYNIGFHGLVQNGYYRYLGKTPSSHGCVRTGREDVERLYKLVDLGTPVMVYDSTPARVFAFADSATFDTTTALKLGSRTKTLGKLLDERLELLYTGRLYERQPFPVYMDGSTQLRPGGYSTGDSSRILKPQAKPVILTVTGGARLQSAVQDRVAKYLRFALMQAPTRRHDSLAEQMQGPLDVDSLAESVARKLEKSQVSNTASAHPAKGRAPQRHRNTTRRP